MEITIEIVYQDKDKGHSVAIITAPTVDMAIEKLGAWERSINTK